MSEKVKMNADAKSTSFVLHIAADAATHGSENANVESEVSMFLHISRLLICVDIKIKTAII
jgi:hypothetical protein